MTLRRKGGMAVSEISAEAQDSSIPDVISSVNTRISEYLESLISQYSAKDTREIAKTVAVLKVVRKKLSLLLEDALTIELEDRMKVTQGSLSDELGQARERAARFKKLVDVSLYLNASLDHDTVLSRIMETAGKVMEAQASSLVLLDEDPKFLSFKVALGEKGSIIKSLRIKAGEGIAGTVVATGETIYVSDVEKDSRFAKRFDQATGFVTKSILCVPIKIKDNDGIRTIGALEVVNPDNEKGFYDNEDVEMLQALANLAAVSIENAQAYQNAITDRLTKLYNFGFFQDQLSREIYRSARYGSEFSLVMIDVDHFKEFNDTYGHLVGNEALKHLAHILIESVRESDIISRYGGEEFAVILPETYKEEAYHFSERFRRKIEATPLNLPDIKGEIGITVSIGIASFPVDGKTAEQVFLSADSALYAAKNRGRNQTSLFNVHEKEKKGG